VTNPQTPLDIELKARKLLADEYERAHEPEAAKVVRERHLNMLEWDDAAALRAIAKALTPTLSPLDREADCPVCHADCAGANPPMIYCPMRDDRVPRAEPVGILDLADKAVAWALDALSGYSCEECDAGIHYAQARGFDRWSMQAQIDHPACFGCEGTALTAEGEPCPVCQPAPAQPLDREEVARIKAKYDEATWAHTWAHNIVPPGKPAQELACDAIRVLPMLFDVAAQPLAPSIHTSETLVEALQSVTDLFAREGESSLDRFERLAAMFHKDTGFVAPGKDAPAAGSMQPDPDELRRAYDDWFAGKVKAARTALQSKTGEGK
jgi:hypothetical protein